MSEEITYNNAVIFSVGMDHSIHFIKWSEHIDPGAKQSFYIIENTLLFSDDVQPGVYKSVLILEADMTSESGFIWIISDEPNIFKNLFVV